MTAQESKLIHSVLWGSNDLRVVQPRQVDGAAVGSEQESVHTDQGCGALLGYLWAIDRMISGVGPGLPSRRPSRPQLFVALSHDLIVTSFTPTCIWTGSQASVCYSCGGRELNQLR